MGSKRVKGITVEIGGNTTKLNKALEGTNKHLGSTQSSLKDVERLLKLDPTNTQLLEQKQRLLADAVSDTSEKLDVLKQAEKQVQEQFAKGEITQERYDDLQREIITTEQQMRKLQEASSLAEKGLNGISVKAKDTQTELKEVNRLLDLDPGNFVLLEQKQEILTESIKETETALERMEEAYNWMLSTGNSGIVENEKAFRDLERQIEESKIALNGLKSEAAKTEKAIDGIDESSIKDVADAAEQAEDELNDMATAAQTVRDRASGIADKFQPVTAAVTGLGAAVVATVPATEELREDLSKLDANAKDNAVSVDAAREAWEAFAIQSGETDSAVEAVSNLLQANFTESNLQKAVEGLAGAALKFPDTLKIESLADSLQETLASGSATGQFSELLSRLGMDAEAFSEQLAACTTEAEKQDLVLQTLSSAGLNSTYEAWKNNNSEMLANKEANLELQQSMAEMAEVVMPIVTTVTNAMADFVSWFANLSPTSQTAIVAILAVIAAIAPMAKAVSGAAGLIDMLSKVNLPGLTTAFGKITGAVLPGVQNTFSSVFGFIAANPIVLLIAAIVGLVALVATKGDEMQALLQKFDTWLQGVFATDWTKVFGPVLGGALNSFFSMAKGIWDSLKQILDGAIDFIRGVFTGDWERAWSGVVSIFSGIFSGILNFAKAPINGVISLVNSAIGAINSLIGMINRIPGVNVGTIGQIPMMANGGTLFSGDAIVGEAGPELLTVSGGRAIVRPLGNSSTTNNTAHFGGTTINVYAQPGQDVHEIAREVSELMDDEVARKAAVFGD